MRKIDHKLLVLECPSCGSGDVQWCNISIRPYCNECNTWGIINHGSKQDAIKLWNDRVRKSKPSVLSIVLDELQTTMVVADKKGQSHFRLQLESLQARIKRRIKKEL